MRNQVGFVLVAILVAYCQPQLWVDARLQPSRGRGRGNGGRHNDNESGRGNNGRPFWEQWNREDTCQWCAAQQCQGTDAQEPTVGTTTSATPTLAPTTTTATTTETTTSATSVPSEQCACYKVAGSGKCFAYDTSRGAMSLTEAIANFGNPVDLDPRSIETKALELAATTTTTTEKHSSESSESSESDSNSESDSESDSESESDSNEQSFWYGKPSSTTTKEQATTCSQSRTCRQCMRAVADRLQDVFDTTQDEVWRNETIDLLEHLESDNNLTDVRDSECAALSGKILRRRSKRQYYSSSSSLDCSYTKGSPLPDGSGYLGMCSLCWSWRMLSSNYVPRVINEMACASDTACLGGYGTCRPRYMSMTVLYNSGSSSNPSYNEMSMSVQSGCECQIHQSSAIAYLTSM